MTATDPRYEIKLTCDEAYLPDVRVWLDLHPEAFFEAYPPRQVNSLYFDTLSVESLDDNLIGTGERRKLRFRWYGTDYTSVRGRLELKRKSNYLGWKEYHPLPDTYDLTTTAWEEIVSRMRARVEGPFALWLAQMSRPVLLNGYMREYYESADRQLRVTLDYRQAAYEQLTHLVPNLRLRSPTPSYLVVEVKASPRHHRRVSDLLSSFPIPVVRNSKYVIGVLESLCFL